MAHTQHLPEAQNPHEEPTTHGDPAAHEDPHQDAENAMTTTTQGPGPIQAVLFFSVTTNLKSAEFSVIFCKFRLVASASISQPQGEEEGCKSKNGHRLTY
jgi:hypothetical protein